MCRKVFVAVLVISFFLVEQVSAIQYAYVVTFTDKNGTPYSLSSPLAYLSSRALARRSAQGIVLDSTDLPVNPAYISSVLTLTGGILHESSRWLNLCVVLLSDSTQIHALDGKPFIKNTQYIAYYASDLHFKESGSPHPSTPPPASKTTSGDSGYYGYTWQQTTMVNGNYLHDIGFDGTGKLIAVLDAGYIYTDTHFGFDTLRATGRIVDSHNFTLASDNIYAYDTHGTEVLSTMAGYAINMEPNNFVGSAPQASYALYITEDDNSEQPIELLNMLCGAERADSVGADVITTSLGYNTFDNAAFNFNFATDFDGKTTVAAQAANIATKKGILFVATAGNEGGDPWNMILTPGDADSALTIGSVDATETPWSTSGYGPNAAGQIKPDVCALGHTAYVFSSNFYEPLDGTSLSTPQIAGWAACLWQANPGATPAQIRQAIRMCASSYSSPTNHIGYGVPNFQCTEQVLRVKDTPSPVTPSNWILATPNPFSDVLKLSVSPDQNDFVDFCLTDISGKKIISFHQYFFKGYNAPYTVSLPALPPGFYILKAVSPTQQQVLKLEKQPY